MTAPASASEVFDDLEAEDDRLEVILAGLEESQWAAQSAAPGWAHRTLPYAAAALAVLRNYAA